MLDESDEEEMDIENLIGEDERGWTEDVEDGEEGVDQPGNHDTTIDQLLGDCGVLEDAVDPAVLDEFHDEFLPDDPLPDPEEDEPVVENDQGDSDSSDSDSSDEYVSEVSDYEEVLNTTRLESSENVGRRKKKKRLVNTLDACTVMSNFDPYTVPEKKKSYSFVMEKATKRKKEQKIVWQNYQTPEATRGRHARENIMTLEQGTVGPAQDALTPRQCWEILITPDMLSTITKCTNIHINNYLEDLSLTKRMRMVTNRKDYLYAKETDEVEMAAFLGLFYVRGLLKQNYWERDRLFSDLTGHPVFCATMSRNRFSFLNKHLCFDDPETRPERWKKDRFAACREFFEEWNDNCSAAVQAGDYLAIDECLYALRNKLSFKQYNKTKPAKYGLLFKELNSVRIPYTHRSEVYAGKPMEEGDYYVKGTDQITLRLIDRYQVFCEVKGRNVSFDNLYTSIPLAQELMKRGLTCIGTVKFNRRGVPKEIRAIKGREENSTVVWWEKEKQKMTLTSYVVNTKSKGKKNVVVLSTKPVLLGLTKDDGKKKPAVIKEYDFSKGGTDIVDQRSASYTTSTKSPR